MVVVQRPLVVAVALAASWCKCNWLLRRWAGGCLRSLVTIVRVRRCGRIGAYSLGQGEVTVPGERRTEGAGGEGRRYRIVVSGAGADRDTVAVAVTRRGDGAGSVVSDVLH